MRIRLGVWVAGLALIACATALRAEDANTGTITGKVIDASGAVVKGAKVTTMSAPAMPNAPADGAFVPVTATSGDDGTFTLEKVPPGRVKVMASTTDPKARGLARSIILVKAGQTKDAGAIMVK